MDEKIRTGMMLMPPRRRGSLPPGALRLRGCLLVAGVLALGACGDAGSDAAEGAIDGLQIATPAPLRPTTGGPGAPDAQLPEGVTEARGWVSEGGGVTVTVLRVDYEEGAVPPLEDAATRVVGSAKRRVDQIEGASDFRHVAEHLGVSGRYAIEVSVSYRSPTGERWTRGLFIEDGTTIWQIQVIPLERALDATARESAEAVLRSVSLPG